MLTSRSKIVTTAAVMMLVGCTTANSNKIVSTKDGYRQVGSMVWDKTGSVAKKFDDKNIPENQSRMVFIRSQDDADYRSSANIGIDDLFQVSLQGGNYSTVYTCAGEHQISSNPTKAHINDLSQSAKMYTTKAGSTQYFYIDGDDAQRVVPITEKSALALLQNMPYAQQTHQVSRVLAQNCVKADQVVQTKQEEKPVVKVEVDKPISLHVEFDFNRATVRPQYNSHLEAVAKFMEDRPNTVVLIEGHTDSRGNDAYNQDLSERRAAAVMQQLVNRYGLDEGRINSEGFGESRPVASNNTDEGRQRNRRVDALITVKNR